MSARSLRITGLGLVALTCLGATRVGAQERRRSPDGGGAPPVGAPTYPRMPFAGAWQGTRRMEEGPGSTNATPYVMVIESDSAGRRYSGYALLPGGHKAPVQRLTEANGVLSWHQANSGGGTWVYTARLVGRERIEGTLVLRDWPQGGGASPSGTLTLVRRPPA
ncbi:MAG: hypothetical protein H7066_04120 [Cytophagaceae bacterium]|nr:hypothetical protein [Gemmatimonadaceae bacterium]